MRGPGHVSALKKQVISNGYSWPSGVVTNGCTRGHDQQWLTAMGCNRLSMEHIHLPMRDIYSTYFTAYAPQIIRLKATCYCKCIHVGVSDGYQRLPDISSVSSCAQQVPE